MLVRPDDYSIDDDRFEIGIVCQCYQDTFPNPSRGPATKAFPDAVPLAEERRQVAQGHPARAIQTTASTNSRLSSPGAQHRRTFPEASARCVPIAHPTIDAKSFKASRIRKALNHKRDSEGIWRLL
jgi:hypothetical protein